MFAAARLAGGSPEAGRVVRLGGRFVVTPYGGARAYVLSDGAHEPGHAERLRRDGVIYALALADRYSWAANVTDRFDGLGSVDAAYATAGGPRRARTRSRFSSGTRCAWSAAA